MVLFLQRKRYLTITLNAQVLGCDCLGVIYYFDANLVDDSGEGFLIKNAICMHEEDAGIGWKHTG